MKSRILLSIIGGASVIALAGCGQKSTPAAEANLEHGERAGQSSDEQAMRVVRLSKRDLDDAITSTGRLVLREEASVGSELAGFRVAAVYVDEGDWVQKGERLARLDDSLLQAQIAQAEAALAQQTATADFKESQLSRAESLGEAGAFSQETIEMRRMEAIQARAAVKASEANVNEMKVRQSRMVLRAPVAGRVLSRNIRPGDISSMAGSGGAPYFRIARDGLIELEADLPLGQLQYLKEGAAAQVVLSTGETLDGKIRFISPVVDPRTSLGSARIELGYNDALREGSFAEARFAAEARDVVAAPASAIRYEAGGPSVMLVDDASTIKQVPVQLGSRIGDYVEILDGPPEGSKILLIGTAFVLDGDRITPVEETVHAPANLVVGEQ